MSVTNVDRDSKGHTGRKNEKGVREYSVEWIVKTNDVQDGPQVVMNAAGIPTIGALYQIGNDLDLGAKCRSVDPHREGDSRKVWRVRAEYSSEATKDDQQQPENPLQRPAEVSWQGVVYSKPAIKDIITNKAIATAADEKFDPPPEMDDVRQVLQITKNYATFDNQQALDYSNSINSDNWMGGEPETWKFQPPSAVRVIEGDYVFWRVSFEFHYRAEKWKLSVLHQGYWAKDGADKKLILDKTFQPITKPALLDEDGAELAMGGTPVFREFDIYKKRSFGALNLV